MIDGIEIELTYEDLHRRLLRRAGYHASEQKRYEGLAAAVEPTNNAIDKIYYDDRKHDAAMHGKQAQFFWDVADHLVRGEGPFRLKIEQFRDIFVAEKEGKP